MLALVSPLPCCGGELGLVFGAFSLDSRGVMRRHHEADGGLTNCTGPIPRPAIAERKCCLEASQGWGLTLGKAGKESSPSKAEASNTTSGSHCLQKGPYCCRDQGGGCQRGMIQCYTQSSLKLKPSQQPLEE